MSGMNNVRYVMKYTNPTAIRSDIYPCSKYFCVCIEYLNFGNKKDINRYKHCYTTDERNKKYEKAIIQSDPFKEFLYNYS